MTLLVNVLVLGDKWFKTGTIWNRHLSPHSLHQMIGGEELLSNRYKAPKPAASFTLGNLLPKEAIRLCCLTTGCRSTCSIQPACLPAHSILYSPAYLTFSTCQHSHTERQCVQYVWEIQIAYENILTTKGHAANRPKPKEKCDSLKQTVSFMNSMG